MSCQYASLIFAAPICPSFGISANLPNNSAVRNTFFMKLDSWKFC